MVTRARRGAGGVHSNATLSGRGIATTRPRSSRWHASGDVARRIGDARRREALRAQPAGVAVAAGAALRRRPGSTTPSARNRRRGARLRARCRPWTCCSSGAWTRMPRAFHAGLGGEVGEPLEGRDEFRPAIRIAGIVDRVDAAEDVGGAEHFGPAQRHRQHDGVARRHVGDRNAGGRRMLSDRAARRCRRSAPSRRCCAGRPRRSCARRRRARARRGRRRRVRRCGAGRSARSARGTRSPARARGRGRRRNPCRRRPGRLRFSCVDGCRASGSACPARRSTAACAAASGSAPATGRRRSSRPARARRASSLLGENSTSQRSASSCSATHVARPFVVGASAEHELDLVVRGQQRQVVPAVARDFERTRRLDVEHARHARVDFARYRSRRRSPAKRHSRHRTSAAAGRCSASAPAARRR